MHLARALQLAGAVVLALGVLSVLWAQHLHRHYRIKEVRRDLMALDRRRAPDAAAPATVAAPAPSEDGRSGGGREAWQTEETSWTGDAYGAEETR